MIYNVILIFLAQLFCVNSSIFYNVNIKALSRIKLQKHNNSSVLEFGEIVTRNTTKKISLIYPGTKWCGAGDVANNFNDLGVEWRTDMCCREHDYCPDTITAGETRYNLTNEAFYTRLSCQCDEQFRVCLQGANSLAAENVGFFYFNALNTKCYRKSYPAVKCLKKGGWLNKKCLVYQYDTSAEEYYQWFDVSSREPSALTKRLQKVLKAICGQQRRFSPEKKYK